MASFCPLKYGRMMCEPQNKNVQTFSDVCHRLQNTLKSLHDDLQTTALSAHNKVTLFLSRLL